ncbi:ATP synthase subunit delta, mitochondrial [Fusarium keratoplasticum]|uniref:ATP synthase subunit delta, mitochondrial n=1 Tax=Fusarium keratoplasticum TaxID=1328300 RepID=A0ACC0R564_9HYPO|nr:ATP synthase subunit delta, mitochondrial [Fusarium keratoplasticum]KAI8671626.1 ATP synthase subunit delta, mitochondrial [Fusarium keratoplasticum]
MKPKRTSQTPNAPGDPKIGHRISEPNLGSIRSSVSAAELRAGRSSLQRKKSSIVTRRSSRRPLTEEPYSAEPSALTKAFTSPIPSTYDSATVSSTERRRDAMDIFEQYGISRPEGWLSEEDSGTAEPPEDGRVKTFQVCHSCGAPLSSQRYCLHCGHDSCLKCTGNALDEGSEREHGHSLEQHLEQHTTNHCSKESTHATAEAEQSHVHTTQVTVRTTRLREASRFTSGQETPRTPHWVERTSRRRFRTTQNAPKPTLKKTIAAPTAISSSVKNNPFYMADIEAKAHASEPTNTPRTVQAKRPTRLSDCVPHRPTLNSSSDKDAEGKCSDPGCRATHAGHHPVRHSIECAARRSLKGQITEDDELEVIDMDEEQEPQRPKNSPLHSTLEKRIDQLYHHAEDLHHSQHIMEHLAAGARQLERSAGTQRRRADRKDALSRMTDHGLDIPSRSPGDHQLSQDEVTSVGEETVEYSLGTDIKAPEAVEEHTLAADPAVERDLSPRSHLLLDDVRTKVARLLKAHSISQDRVFGAKSRPIRRLRRSFPLAKTTTSTKPVSQAKPLPLSLGEQEKVSKACASWEQKMVSPAKEQSLVMDTHTSVHAAHTALSSKRGPRQIPPRIKDPEQEAVESNGISSWRKQLRKVTKSEDVNRDKQLTPPVVKWRRSLSRIRRTPNSDAEKKDNCLFCYPSRSPSPKPGEGATQLAGEVQSREAHDATHGIAVESSTPRLRVMEVEQSLARKSAEDLLEESRHRTQQEVVATREMKSTKHCKTTSHSSYEETETVTEIHNPKPVIPYNHVCAWRTRYMDLSTEVDQLKSEASFRVVDQATEQQRDQGVDAGVGTSFSHKCPDIDIEGLTIVMHMRGKDDLVINTKLKDSARHG